MAALATRTTGSAPACVLRPGAPTAVVCALVPDSPATTTLRATRRAIKDLVTTRVTVADQRRAHLQTASPAALALRQQIDSPTPDPLHPAGPG